MATQLNATRSTTSTHRDDIEISRKPMRKDKQKTNDDQSSTAVCYRRSSSLSSTAKQASLEEEETGLRGLKTLHNDQGVSWKWLTKRKGKIRTKKLTGPTGRRSTESREKCSPGEVDETQNEIDSVGDNISTRHSFNSDRSRKGKSKRSSTKDQCRSSTSLSTKYQPKLFEDIAGHEIIVKALSNAVQKEKIAPLYLFHGPSGTGKTSTARIFSMALNCESAANIKPCWTCKGCTRSLYVMDLCSGSRLSGFERIKTLLQSTSFSQIVTGFKVFIIEECHSLTPEAWDEILNIVERGSGSGSTEVFVLVTEDVAMVPKGVSSKCQKFCFAKLKDMDITLKLARTVSREGIEIEREALRLITSKADGSMREAENILDQLVLLGSRITSPMVQQIVGLVPHNKLLGLLTTVLSADTVKTVRSTRELIASGVQPLSILSQLASLVTDILSGAAAASTGATSSKEKRLSRSGSQLTNEQSERLSHALKILVETEKQLDFSNDQTNWVVAALLQIAPTSIALPQDIVIPSDSAITQRNEISEHLLPSRSKRSEMSTHDLSSLMKSISKRNGYPREPSFGQIGNMEEVWKSILGRIETQYVKEFLSQQGKIASLTISSANAIVHLIFKRPEDKLAAQMSEETIENALSTAFGCPVSINMSLQPRQIEINEGLQCSTPFLPPSESPRTRTTRSRGPETVEVTTTRPQQIVPFSGALAQGQSATPRDRENVPSVKHRWLSVSSIQHGDASVERYSQDLVFENENNDSKGKNRHSKLHKVFVKENEDQQYEHKSKPMVLNRSWSCSEVLCRRGAKVINRLE